MIRSKPIITEPNAAPQEPASQSNAKRRLPGLRLALLAGVLLWAANPPLTLWPLAWVGLIPLLLSVTRANGFRQAAWRGYLFGWVYLGAVWYWTGLTIVAWTGSLIGWAAWFGLTLILAGFYAAWGGAAWWLARRPRGVWRITALAAAWVVMEWARTLGALTMPWAQLSYTQTHFLPILQVADLTGAYGISFLILLVNAALASQLSPSSLALLPMLPRFARRERRDSPHPYPLPQEQGRGTKEVLGDSFAPFSSGGRRAGDEGEKRELSTELRVALALVTVACLYGFVRLRAPEDGKPLTVAAMQGNFKMHETVEDVPNTLHTFSYLTHRATTEAPIELAVWSESAAPGDALHYPPARQLMNDLTRRYRIAMLVGSRVEDPNTEEEANASLLFTPDSPKPVRYDKRQLVSFGEFIPFRRYWPPFLTSAFQFFEKDVTPGRESVPLRFDAPRAGAVAVGPFICYESMYPNYPRWMTRAGANLLATQSNDTWFQSHAAMEQHVAAVVLRAVENRRDIVRATNSGITCLIDSRGRIVQRAPLETATYITGTVHLHEGQTLYTRFGDWFVALCGLFCLVAAFRGKPEAREA